MVPGILGETESAGLSQNHSVMNEQLKGNGKKDLVEYNAQKVRPENSGAKSFSSSIKSVQEEKNKKAQEIIDKISLIELSRPDRSSDEAGAVDISDFSQSIAGEEKVLLDSGKG
jgi:hypothetical protein